MIYGSSLYFIGTMMLIYMFVNEETIVSSDFVRV